MRQQLCQLVPWNTRGEGLSLGFGRFIVTGFAAVRFFKVVGCAVFWDLEARPFCILSVDGSRPVGISQALNANMQQQRSNLSHEPTM